MSRLPYWSSEDIGDPAETAYRLAFYDNNAAHSSAIERPGDRDLFRIDAAESLPLRVEVSIPLYSELQAQVTLYDSSMTQLAVSDVSTNYAVARIMAEAGQTYYAAVAYGDSLYETGTNTGSYTLLAGFERPATDAISDTFADAERLSLDGDGFAYYESRIDESHDEDMFRFTATFDGEIEVQMKSILGSDLDSVLFAYDDEFNLIGQNDDVDEDDRNSKLVFSVVRDRTYYLKATGYISILDGVGSTGDYALSLYRATGTPTPNPTPAPASLDDYSDTREFAHPIAIERDAAFTIDGVIEHGYDLDFFRLVSPLTGTLTITITPRGEGNLDTELLIQNSDGESLGTNDNVSETDRSSRLQLDVREGVTYYVIAAASLKATPDRATGGYRLTVLPPGVPAPEDDETAPDAPTP